ncbi:hypothetical protein [Caulobacter phage Cr30]|uniref:hypothetical protein n=1 Tax=Caulobacter phage Cr30 TaxID=1357714 RepID=UPI0004A9B964|nr:hypothetical protein OZ74_gp012 [Caulobacter phage Cr30]AGS80897.1 hypothetical protein [Caulobacter phage Cr30]
MSFMGSQRFRSLMKPDILTDSSKFDTLECFVYETLYHKYVNKENNENTRKELVKDLQEFWPQQWSRQPPMIVVCDESNNTSETISRNELHFQIDGVNYAYEFHNNHLR